MSTERASDSKSALELLGLEIRICEGAITFCDGDCENCGNEEEEYEAY